MGQGVRGTSWRCIVVLQRPKELQDPARGILPRRKSGRFERCDCRGGFRLHEEEACLQIEVSRTYDII